MWCAPGRSCGVKLVMNVGFRAIKSAGECRERGSYAHLVGSRRGRGWCGEVEERSESVGRSGHCWNFWWYDAHGHKDHAKRRRSRRQRSQGVGDVRIHANFKVRRLMGDGRWVGDSGRVSKVCGAYLGGGAG